MITVEEMAKLLKEEYGINNGTQLDKELKKLGGIKIGIFKIPKKKEANTNSITNNNCYVA